jgi:hypothetical protein
MRNLLASSLLLCANIIGGSLLTPAVWGTAFTQVPVTCKEFPPNTHTSPLDIEIAGPTISAGGAADHCQFTLTGVELLQPFAAGDLTYTNTADKVCWHTGGFCVSGPQLVTMNLTPTADGTLFTIVSASITTTFTLPSVFIGDPPSGEVPEPGTLHLVGIGIALLLLRYGSGLGGLWP